MATATFQLTTGVVYVRAWTGTVGGASLTLTGTVLASDGAPSAVTFGRTANAGSGIFFNGNDLCIANQGIRNIYLGASQVQFGSGIALGWASTSDSFGGADLVLVRDAANTLAQRNGTNAQFFSLYATSSASNANYERTTLGFDGTSFYLKGGDKGGTGTARPFNIGTIGNSIFNLVTNDTTRWSIGATTGHILAFIDNTYDIGASGATRPRTGYFGTSLVVGAGTTLSEGAAGKLTVAGTTPMVLLGGTSSSFPAIKQNGTTLEVKLADDSTFAGIKASTGNFTGAIQTVSGVSTTGTFGVPPIVAVAETTGLTGADTNRINYTPAAASSTYELTGLVNVTAWTTPASFTLVITYKDASGNARTDTATVSRGSTGATAAAITAIDRWYFHFPAIDIDNSATAITMSTTGTFTGTPTYNIQGTLRRVR